MLNRIRNHIGCMVIDYFYIGVNGENVGEQKTYSITGFFLSVDEKWYFVTAGHVFLDERTGIESLLKSGKIRIVQTTIFDCIEHGADNRPSTIIGYDSNMICAIDDDNLGLDYAFYFLRPFYVTSIQCNGSLPFPLRLNASFSQLQTSACGIVGFPNEEKIIGNNSRTAGSIRPVLVWFEPIGFTPSDESKYERLVGRLHYDRPDSVVGMSGGPAFILYENDILEIHYQLIGIQSSWMKSTRKIYICLMNYIVPHMQNCLSKLPN